MTCSLHTADENMISTSENRSLQLLLQMSKVQDHLIREVESLKNSNVRFQLLRLFATLRCTKAVDAMVPGNHDNAIC